jgi:segregation and condensation protein B
MTDLPADPPADPSPPPPEPTGELTLETRRALEAIVMVAADPVPPQMLAQLLEISVERVEEACARLAAEYEQQHRGFVLVRVAGGYRFQSHPEASPYVERYVLEGQSARLSSAALETLAIVAYKQPLSRAQVASIRGVNVDGVMRTLTHRGLVAEVARDPGPGQAVLYGTTPLFLERLGLDALDDLPAIASFVPGADVVEALEHSLRVTPDEPAPDPAEDDAEDDVEPDDEIEEAPRPTEADPVASEPADADPVVSPAEPVRSEPVEDVDLAALGDAQDWEDPDDGGA